jgi:hypothetical protein
MGNDLVTTNGDAPSGGTAFGREDVARGSVFDGAQTAILPEEAIDKELTRFIHHRWRNRAPGMGARVIAGACCADWTGP